MTRSGSPQGPTIRQRLLLLSGSLLLLLLALQLINYRSSEQLARGTQQLAEVEMPAIRSMTLADMMHDGLRAVAYRSLAIPSSELAGEAPEIRKELAEMTEDIHKHLKSLEELNLKPETKSLIKAALPSVESYTTEVKSLVDVALSGDRGAAQLKIPTLQAAFSDLEEKLGKLGELIENEATEASTQSLASSRSQAPSAGFQLS